MITRFAFALALLFFSLTSSAQINLAIQANSKLRIDGTSTMHDYSLKTSAISGAIVVDSASYFNTHGMNSPLFRRAEINIPVRTLKSGDEKLDDNAYDTMNEEEYPNITYSLSLDSIASSSTDSTLVKTRGKLTIAGMEKHIEMMVTLRSTKDGFMHITGRKELLMSDFGVDPPTFMFVITTDDKVVVSFELIVKTQLN